MIYTCLGELYCLNTSILMHTCILELVGTFVYSVASDPFVGIIGLVERLEEDLGSI